MSSLFDSWKRLFDRPQGELTSRGQEIKAWQKTLLEEHEGLRDELELLLRTYVRTIDRFVERANDLSEEQFAQEQESIESIRKILQNAIRRLEVSCKDHRELLDEWHEWVAFRRAVGQRQELSPAHQLRVEMIRSELAVRGIQVEQPVGPEDKQSVATVVAVEVAPASTAGQAATIVRMPVLDDLADWKEVRRPHIEPECRDAEEAWLHIAEQAYQYPERAVAFLKRLREAHGELKLLDRAERRRRYRIAVFS